MSLGGDPRLECQAVEFNLGVKKTESNFQRLLNDGYPIGMEFNQATDERVEFRRQLIMMQKG